MNRLNSVAELETEYNSLNVAKYKLDVFFDMFLEKYDRKLSGERKKDDPYWKLYNDKFREYEDITRKIAYTKHLLDGKKG